VNLLLTLRQNRQARGLSQQKLAQNAGVSLATIQNLEAGKGNPELFTIQSIANALSLELELNQKEVKSEELVELGVPLLSKEERIPLRRGSAHLAERISHLGSGLINLRPQSREGIALVSYLCALQDHYPSIWNRLGPEVKSWLSINTKNVSPKLRRLSLTTLGKIL
jgi:transcriptional regulator with XRE-family HTH domain